MFVLLTFLYIYVFSLNLKEMEKQTTIFYPLKCPQRPSSTGPDQN